MQHIRWDASLLDKWLEYVVHWSAQRGLGILKMMKMKSLTIFICSSQDLEKKVCHGKRAGIHSKNAFIL